LEELHLQVAYKIQKTNGLTMVKMAWRENWVGKPGHVFLLQFSINHGILSEDID